MEVFLLAASLLSFFGYALTNRMPYTKSWETFLDKKIAYVPMFVIPYLALFPYIVFSYYKMAHTEYALKFLLAVFIANIAATTFWYFFPNGVKRFEVEEKDTFSKILNLIYRHDGDTNGFPSGHVYLALICSYFLTLTQTAFWGLWAFAGGLITMSILFTKQHYIVDIVGGVIFAAIPILITVYLI